jgi:hypothetical protein
LDVERERERFLSAAIGSESQTLGPRDMVLLQQAFTNFDA